MSNFEGICKSCDYCRNIYGNPEFSGWHMAIHTRITRPGKFKSFHEYRPRMVAEVPDDSQVSPIRNASEMV